jgi:DsbC/DsbD-like thiol-disulfide interchange protein
VVDKRIRENYRAREGALKLLEEGLNLPLPAGGHDERAAASHVAVSAAADSDLYVRWQETRLHVIFDVGEAWHVYGRPIPDGYTPVTIEVETIPEVVVGPPEYPPTRPFRVEGLNEDFEVHEGRFEVLVPFAVNVPPGHGTVDLEITVRYQACSESECLPPQGLKLGLHLAEAPPA